jgi:hypothetical protein
VHETTHKPPIALKTKGVKITTIVIIITAKGHTTLATISGMVSPSEIDEKFRDNRFEVDEASLSKG